VKAVSGAMPVLIDGGIHCGTDVFKALDLGATAVMVRGTEGKQNYSPM
jgi:4-hydroxymandelate oxidase